MSLTQPKTLAMVGALFLAGAGFSAYQIAQQHRMVRTHRPLQAVVLGGEIATVSVGTGQSRTLKYRPRVHYRFAMDGETYESTRVTPLDTTGSREWATQVLAAHPSGGKVTAYVDPADPPSAFLLPDYSVKPYAGFLFGLLGGYAAALALWLVARQPRRVGPPAVVVSVLLGMVGAGTLVHFGRTGSPGVEWIAPVAAGVYVASLVVVPWLVVRRLRLHSRTEESAPSA